MPGTAPGAAVSGEMLVSSFSEALNGAGGWRGASSWVSAGCRVKLASC